MLKGGAIAWTISLYMVYDGYSDVDKRLEAIRLGLIHILFTKGDNWSGNSQCYGTTL